MTRRGSASFIATILVAAAIVGTAAHVLGSSPLRREQVPGFQVGGTLRAAGSGAPLRGKVIASQFLADGSASITPLTVGHDGDFVFRNLENGRATIVGVAAGYGRKVLVVTVDVSRPVELEIELPEATLVRGEVVDATGRPVLGAEIRVEYLDRLGSGAPRTRGNRLLFYEGSWESSADDLEAGPGAFIVRNVQPDRRFEIVANHPALGSTRVGPFRLDEAEALTNLEVVLR